VLVALLTVFAAAALLALRLRGPVDAVFLPLALVVVCLAPNGTTLLRDALRNTSVLLAIVPFVLASATIGRRALSRPVPGAGPPPETS
jgi:hypothetical protein